MSKDVVLYVLFLLWNVCEESFKENDVLDVYVYASTGTRTNSGVYEMVCLYEKAMMLCSSHEQF